LTDSARQAQALPEYAAVEVVMSLVLLVGFGFVGLLTLATVAKWLEVRRAATWRAAAGPITRSRSVARKVRGTASHGRAVPGQDLETRNFADIGYEYRVGGKTMRGKRVSVGEDLGDWMVAETLARYPVEARVTVWYDPGDPARAVLERDAPDGVFRTLALFIAVLALGLLVAAFGTRELVALLTANMARPERAVPVVALLAAAGMVALTTKAVAKRAEAARGWPWTEGEILASGAEAVEMYRDGSSFTRRHTLFKPTLLYRYRIGAADLVGTRRNFGPSHYFSSNTRAAKRAAGYRPGDRVAVFHNPENSSESVLEPQAAGLWIGWTAAAVLAALALLLAF
jgi:hypothetical protein